jgi:hypothetical protein
MNETDFPEAIVSLINHLASLPNVVAVTSGGLASRAGEPADRAGDFGVYYRGTFDPKGLMHLDGTITAPGAWGRIRNGGARLTVDGHLVEIHYRDVDAVRHWIRESQSGRFEVDGSSGYLAGVPSYTLLAELALGTVVAGSLDDVIEYPDRLAEEGSAQWRNSARSSLEHADARAEHGDAAGVLGHLARACIEIAHARLCEARQWTVNEKEILERAELTHLNQLLTALNADPVMLMQRVMQARALLLD